MISAFKYSGGDLVAVAFYGVATHFDPANGQRTVFTIREQRIKAQQAAQQAEVAEKLAAGAKTLSDTQVGGGQNALQAMTGIAP